MTERVRPPAPRAARLILYFVLTLLYLPILVMFLNSLLRSGAGGLQLTLDWYAAVLADSKITESLLRSVYLATASSVFATVLGSFAAISLAKTNFKMNKALTAFSYISLIAPELVFALALLSWFFILKISLSMMTVMFAHITFSICFVMMTVQARLQSLDVDVDASARDLGASEFILLTRIWCPLLVPAFLGSFLLSFLLSFDDFLITFYTNGVGRDTLPIQLYVAMKMGLTPKLSALSSLMFIASAILVLGLIKYKNLKTIAE